MRSRTPIRFGAIVLSLFSAAPLVSVAQTYCGVTEPHLGVGLYEVGNSTNIVSVAGATYAAGDWSSVIDELRTRTLQSLYAGGASSASVTYTGKTGGSGLWAVGFDIVIDYPDTTHIEDVGGAQVRDDWYRCPDGYALDPTLSFCEVQNASLRNCPTEPKPDKNRGCPKMNGDESPITGVEGNPCNTGTGNKFQIENDYPAIGSGPTFRRYFNSDPSTPLTRLGPGWRGEFDSKIEFSWSTTLAPLYSGPYRAYVHRPNGRIVVFDISGSAPQPVDPDTVERLEQVDAITYRFRTADDRVETYKVTEMDEYAFLQSIKGPGGIDWTLTYNFDATLAEVKDPYGHKLTFTYDTSGRLKQITDPASKLWKYAYSTAGYLNKVTYPDNTTRQYTYATGGNAGALASIIDESGVTYASWAYDGSRRATSSQHAGGAEQVTLTYNTNGTTSATNALGSTRTYAYSLMHGVPRVVNRMLGSVGEYQTWDTNGYPASYTDRNGTPTTFSYNSRGLEASRTDAYGTSVARTTSTTWHSTLRRPTQIDRGNRRVTFTYDSSGNVLTRTVTDLSNSTARTWTYTYDTTGKRLTENGPRTDVTDTTTYTYHSCTTGGKCGRLNTITNAASKVTTFLTYNAHGLPLTIKDANNVTTTLTYDFRLNLTSQQVGAQTTSFTYWPTGLLKRVTLPDASYLQYTYDNAHRLTKVEDSAGNREEFTLDAMGNRTAINAYDPTSTLARTRTQVFNSLGNLWKAIGAAGTTGVTSVYGYDDNENLTSIAAPLSRSTAQVYDALNRLKQITDPASGVTQYGYDAFDNVVSVTDPRSIATSYTYNALGDITQLVSPDTGTSTRTYDSGGNIATRTDARGKVGTYSYDALNRLTSLGYPDLTTSFTYDAGTNGVGHLTGASDANHSMSFVYDAQGRVTSKTQTVSSIAKTLTYGYTNGNLTSLVTPSGRTIAYGYTAGRVTSVALSPSTTILSQVLYEPLGPVSGWQWGNGTYAVHVYDTDGKITTVDSAGPRNLGYDDAFRVTSLTDTVDNTKSWTYGYDSLDRVTAASKTGTTIGYTYDANSNRLTQTGTQTATYTVDSASNRLSSITGTPSRSYTHDAAGNVTGDGTNAYTFSDGGRLKTVTRSGVTTTYVYNALGQRIKKSNSSTTRYFVYDEAGHLIGEYDGVGALVQETVWLNDIPVATLRPNGAGVSVYYVHSDHQNTPRRLSRPSDNVIVWRWDSDPFGINAASEDPDGDSVAIAYNVRFPGQYFDSESGAHYNYFRDYDPSSGRYLESDPIGLLGGVNTYAYAAANPIRYFDPDGLDIAVIENGPTAGNPIGHTAVAVTGAGVYSFGNDTSAGSSLSQYLLEQAQRRNTKVYVIPTTPEQDAAALDYLRDFPDTSLPKDWPSKLWADNCSVRSNGALSAAGIPYPVVEGSALPPSSPGSSGYRARTAGATVISIPRGSTKIPVELQQFERH